MDWDWSVLWWWVADDAVWEWIRPIGAALIGAIIGGSFTIWGQTWAAREQSKRDTATADRARADTLRDQSRADALKLFSDFTALSRDIRNTPSTFGELFDGKNWLPKWRVIWTDDRSLDIEVRTLLLTDEDTRAQVQTVVHYLGMMARYTEHGPGTFRRQGLTFPIQFFADHLAEEGVAVIGAYLRGERHTTLKERVWVNLRQVEAEYDAWEEREMERAEAVAAEAEARASGDFDEGGASGSDPAQSQQAPDR